MIAVFKGYCRISKNWLELKIKPPLANSPKSVKHTVVTVLSEFSLRNDAFYFFSTPQKAQSIF
jgi:hypothetical protein